MSEILGFTHLNPHQQICKSNMSFFILRNSSSSRSSSILPQNNTHTLPYIARIFSFLCEPQSHHFRSSVPPKNVNLDSGSDSNGKDSTGFSSFVNVKLKTSSGSLSEPQSHQFPSSIRVKYVNHDPGSASNWKKSSGLSSFLIGKLKTSPGSVRRISRNDRLFSSLAAVEASTSDGLTVEGIIASQWTILDENENDWKSHASAIAQSIHLIKKRLRVCLFILSYLCKYLLYKL